MTHHQSISPFVYLPVHQPSTYQLTIHLSTKTIRPFICLSVHVSIHLSILSSNHSLSLTSILYLPVAYRSTTSIFPCTLHPSTLLASYPDVFSVSVAYVALRVQRPHVSSWSMGTPKHVMQHVDQQLDTRGHWTREVHD